jgi:hypothetical protein
LDWDTIRIYFLTSRHPIPPDQLFAISTPTPVWLDMVQQGYHKDPKSQELLTALVVAPSLVAHYRLQDGVLRFKNRIWIGDNPAVQQVLEALHYSAVGGHFGFPVTYKKMKQLFSWKGMKTSTKAFVQACSIFQQANPNRSKYLGLVAPLPIPEGA